MQNAANRNPSTPQAMSLKLRTLDSFSIPSLSNQPCSVEELSSIADDILSFFKRYQSEYLAIASAQRATGARITEMFQPFRWSFPTNTTIQIRPQKGNSLRSLQLSDLGYSSIEEMKPLLDDMARLPKGQYERAFSRAVVYAGLWRLTDTGYLHPSSHFFRHLKIKLLNSEGFSEEYIAAWIGEKSVANIRYYIDSAFYSES